MWKRKRAWGERGSADQSESNKLRLNHPTYAAPAGSAALPCAASCFAYSDDCDRSRSPTFLFSSFVFVRSEGGMPIDALRVLRAVRQGCGRGRVKQGAVGYPSFHRTCHRNARASITPRGQWRGVGRNGDLLYGAVFLSLLVALHCWTLI